jgi:hypothetical protein
MLSGRFFVGDHLKSSKENIRERKSFMVFLQRLDKKTGWGLPPLDVMTTQDLRVRNRHEFFCSVAYMDGIDVDSMASV